VLAGALDARVLGVLEVVVEGVGLGAGHAAHPWRPGRRGSVQQLSFVH
jgi:hypothetical protein